MRVRVLGAGIVGLSCADELRRRGHEVGVVDPAPGRGASYAAAGMLSPSAEVWHGETELFRLGARSLVAWDEYAGRLGVPLHRTGTVLVAKDAGDLQQVHRQAELVRRCGGAAEPLEAQEVRAREPTLAPVAGGLLLPDDHSVDPRAVLAALLRRVPVTRTDVAPVGAPDGAWEGDATVVATGATLPADLAMHLDHPLRGVHGEVVRAVTDDPPHATVRGWVRGVPVYVVPRAVASGSPGREVVVGATQEERAGGSAPTIGGVGRLLGAVCELLPGMERAEITELTARDRPGTPDNLPLVGPSGRPGEVLAAGHFRHGVLLAPLTAQLVADHLEAGSPDHAPEPALDPRRFARRRPPEEAS